LQDPVNNFDLAGTACKKKDANKGDCRSKQKRAERGVRRVVAHLRARLQAARERASSSVALPGGGNLTLPWEKEAKEAVNMATGLLQEINDATSCDDASKLAGAGAGWYTYRASRATDAVAAASTKLAGKFALVAAVLAVADLAGFC
jgi:hypothetical protein